MAVARMAEAVRFGGELGQITCRSCHCVIGRHELCDGQVVSSRPDLCPSEVCQRGAKRADHAADCAERWAPEVTSADPERLAVVQRALQRRRSAAGV
jgi:hypothetical protein